MPRVVTAAMGGLVLAAVWLGTGCSSSSGGGSGAGGAGGAGTAGASGGPSSAGGTNMTPVPMHNGQPVAFTVSCNMGGDSDCGPSSAFCCTDYYEFHRDQVSTVCNATAGGGTLSGEMCAGANRLGSCDYFPSDSQDKVVSFYKGYPGTPKTACENGGGVYTPN